MLRKALKTSKSATFVEKGGNEKSLLVTQQKQKCFEHFLVDLGHHNWWSEIQIIYLIDINKSHKVHLDKVPPSPP